MCLQDNLVDGAIFGGLIMSESAHQNVMRGHLITNLKSVTIRHIFPDIWPTCSKMVNMLTKIFISEAV